MRSWVRTAGLFLCLCGLAPTVATAADALVMGVFPRRSATLTNQLFQPLADYLARNLGRPVKLVTAKDFAAFWKGVESRHYDIVHYNQYHYVISSGSYQVIAHNEEFGKGTIAGALYVRKDSGITGPAQLRGKTVVFGGGPDAMMSSIVPRYLLLQAGLHDGDYHAEYAPNPPNALLAVYFRQADAAGVGDVVIQMPLILGKVRPGELAEIAESPQLTHLPWAVRRDMPAALRKRIQALLVGLSATADGRAILKAARLTGMGAASDGDYAACRKIIDQVMPERGR